jgi:hypothetical protein
MERTLWQIDSPQKPTSDFNGTYEIANYTGVGDGTGFRMELRLPCEGAYGPPSGVLTTPADRDGNIDVWKLEHVAQSGNEIRLHFRPKFPCFWCPGMTFVGHRSDNRKGEHGYMHGDVYFHLRGWSTKPWIMLFHADKP